MNYQIDTPKYLQNHKPLYTIFQIYLKYEDAKISEGRHTLGTYRTRTGNAGISKGNGSAVIPRDGL